MQQVQHPSQASLSIQGFGLVIFAGLTVQLCGAEATAHTYQSQNEAAYYFKNVGPVTYLSEINFYIDFKDAKAVQFDLGFISLMADM